MNAARTWLAWLGRHASYALAAGVFTGLAVPPLAALLRPAFVPAVVLLLTLSMARIDPARLRRTTRSAPLIGLALAIALVAAPALVALVTLPLGLPVGIRTGVVLYAGAPPLVAAAAFALLLGLDAALALTLTVLGTALVPFVLPPLADLLLGLELPLSVAAMSLRLALLIGTCFAGAWLLRRVVGAAGLERARLELDGAFVVLMSLFAVAVMDGVAARLLADPAWVALALLAAFALNFGLQAVGALLARPLGPERSLTLGLCAGNRNLGVVVAALGAQAPFELVAFLALAQIPIYVAPLLIGPIARRLVPRTEGPGR